MSVMSPRLELLTEQFEQLRQTTEEIVHLNCATDHTNYEKLAQLQQKQFQLRAKIDDLRTDLGDVVLTPQIEDIIQACIQMEQQIHVKCSGLRDEALRNLNQIKNGMKVKNAYTGSYAQIDGYFIDKHK